jgi:hypothetical protein
MNGKIASLPAALRNQLNRRLHDGAETRKQLLAWLNSLPEVTIPISRQNLHEWTKHGFRTWRMRQDALDFSALHDSDAPDAQTHIPGLTDKLVRWLALRLAATAHTLTPDDDNPDADLRRLRHFAADIVSLRRGELYSRRIALDEQRLARLQAESEAEREKQFWQWTKRADIRAELFGQALKSKVWHDLIRKNFPDLAPFLPKDPTTEPDETAAPNLT